jgi:hypothetical protein
MQTLVSIAGVPSHDNFVASNCAPGAPIRGPSGASRAISAMEVPSFGATL